MDSAVTDILPDPNDTFTVKVECSRNPTADKPDRKVYMDISYPAMNYGGMVSLQKMLHEGVLGDLVRMGEGMAAAIGQPVPTPEQMLELLSQNKQDESSGTSGRARR